MMSSFGTWCVVEMDQPSDKEVQIGNGTVLWEF